MAVSVGFIGVGNMGNPMAGNVLKAGFPMTVFDKHAPAMKNLVDGGARAATSAREAVEASEVVLTCLPASPDVGRSISSLAGWWSAPGPAWCSST
jgi:3-hydroxyisobutyrate dehydrogenase-like beta-hydroxyacid dehydrogenase